MSMKDRVAIAGASTTGFVATNLDRTQASLAAEACIDVIGKCGITRDDIDGLCGSWPSAAVMQSTLGIPEVTWFGNPVIPMVDHVATAPRRRARGLVRGGAGLSRCLPRTVEQRFRAEGSVPQDRHTGAVRSAARPRDDGRRCRVYRLGLALHVRIRRDPRRFRVGGDQRSNERRPQSGRRDAGAVVDGRLSECPDDPRAAVSVRHGSRRSMAPTRSSSRPPNAPGTWRCRRC